jgi:cytochrome c oxidase assembly protein subunit 15
VGAIPPLDAAQWEETFAKYRATPEFRLRNHDMTLEGFKSIFWWEYFHRLLGRIVGAVFLVPFAYFLWRRAIPPPLAWKLAGIFALGGLQGALGWYMVKSGLVDDPRVSSVRLAAHLGLAFLIYAGILWLALAVSRRSGPRAQAHAPGARVLVALVFAMVISGALVAGIRAGLAYNTFPLMNGHWIPPETFVIDPWWKNFVYNMATVQLVHRTLALVIVVGAIVAWWRVHADASAPLAACRWSQLLLAAVALQVTAGIATLLLRVPIPIAALHQAGAVLVFTCAIGLLDSLSRGARTEPPLPAASARERHGPR